MTKMKKNGGMSDGDDYASKSFQEMRNARREMFALIAVIVCVCLVSSLAFLYCAYKFGFRPYLATLKSSKSDPELNDLLMQDTEANGAVEMRRRIRK